MWPRQPGFPRPLRGREEKVPVQISRLLEAHKIIIQSCLDISEAADKAEEIRVRTTWW